MQTKISSKMDVPITFMFSILPLIDALNGIFRNIPISVLYKLLLCFVLFILINGRLTRNRMMILIASGVYIFFSISINIILGGKVSDFGYPLKLFSNIVLFFMMEQSIEMKCFSLESLSKILNNSSWIFIICYLVPFILGIGNTVYAGGIGYKAFYIAQNELGLLVIVMSFYTAYTLWKSPKKSYIICLLLLFACGMLLNTKTAIIACSIALLSWIIPQLKHSKFTTKVISIISVCVGCLLLKDTVLASISNSIYRFSVLQRKHYDNSLVSSILSGRDYKLENAWQYLCSEHPVMRFLFGNGFCANDIIEMDFFDIFFYLGVIGLLALVVFLLYVYKRIASNALGIDKKIKIIYFIIILIQMALAGHIIMMSMAGCYFILFIHYIINYRLSQDELTEH